MPGIWGSVTLLLISMSDARSRRGTDLFQDSTLMISSRSPFARRVRICLQEHSIRHTERVEDVFKPTAELLEANPLGRVPVLVLRDGTRMADSNVILHTFYDRAGMGSSFLPASLNQRLVVLSWMGLATGFCDKIVEYFLETLRPAPSRSSEVLAEFHDIRDRTLGRLEAHFSGPGEGTIVPKLLTQADFDWGAALAYLNLRWSEKWQKQFPSCAAFLERMESRESFQKTRPPAAN